MEQDNDTLPKKKKYEKPRLERMNEKLAKVSGSPPVPGAPASAQASPIVPGATVF